MTDSTAQPDDDVAHGMSAKDQAVVLNYNANSEPYILGTDSLVQADVPQGVVTAYRWQSSRIYPGTTRDYWLYVPQQYDPQHPACLMVFQDGALYLSPDVNAPTVFDNLIHAKEMPVTLGLFVNAGDIGPGMPIWGGSDNRSIEYDSLDDRYARFLIEELLPEIEKNYAIVSDPLGRAICGISSGGICAFTVAWERPDAFGKVISHCGSFTNVRGGHNYPWLIRQNAPKPIRVFVQSGANDFDIVFGNWPLANREMVAALAYTGYEHQFVFGEGGHSLKHGGAIFPDTVRWLWRDYPKGG